MWKKILALATVFMLPLTMQSAFAASQKVVMDGDHGKLSGILQLPDQKEQYPLVVILHGFTSSKEMPMLAELADDLEQAGIASLRFDFNGHGESEGRFQDMTVLNEIEDAKKAVSYASSLPQVMSVSIAGHSQGGVVASMVAGELGNGKIKSLALMAPAAVLREDAIRGNLFGVQFDSLNPPEYVEIFGGHKVGRNYIKAAQNLPIYETAAGYHGPAFMLHGTGDTVAPYTYSLRYEKIYGKRSKVELLAGFDHEFTQDRTKAMHIVADYFTKQLHTGK